MINGVRKEKRYNKIGITLKMRDDDCIHQLYHDSWIDYNKETTLFCTALWGEDDNNKNSIASPSLDNEQ